MAATITRGLTSEELVLNANKLLPNDFIDYEHVETCIEEDPFTTPENILVCRDNDEIKGLLVYAEPKPLPGINPPREAMDYIWVKLLAIHMGSKQCFTKLLDQIEYTARRSNKRGIRIYGYAPWYFLTGLNTRYYWLREWLAERGYQVVSRAVDYHVDLERYWIERPTIKQGTTDTRIRQATTLDDPVFKWIEEKFSLQWRIEAQLALKKKYGRVYVAKTNNEITGFAVHSATHRERFGPIGVDPEQRGKGIGKQLLIHTLDSMRLLGIRHAIIPWTEHLFFYSWLPGITYVTLYYSWSKTTNF